MPEREYQYVMRCPCGTALTGATEDEIVDVSFAHLREAHPDMADDYEREHILFMTIKVPKKKPPAVRKLTLGVDGDGRSCVIDVVDVMPGPVPGAHGVNVARVHATAESPPPPRLPALGQLVDTSLEPGLLRWLVVEHPPPDPAQGPTTSTTIHHSDALDLVFVHEGSGDLMLQDGPVPVAAGDCIVMPGVDHAMRTGPDGIRLVVVTIGTPPPSAE